MGDVRKGNVNGKVRMVKGNKSKSNKEKEQYKSLRKFESDLERNDDDNGDHHHDKDGKDCNGVIKRMKTEGNGDDDRRNREEVLLGKERKKKDDNEVININSYENSINNSQREIEEKVEESIENNNKQQSLFKPTVKVISPSKKINDHQKHKKNNGTTNSNSIAKSAKLPRDLSADTLIKKPMPSPTHQPLLTPPPMQTQSINKTNNHQSIRNSKQFHVDSPSKPSLSQPQKKYRESTRKSIRDSSPSPAPSQQDQILSMINNNNSTEVIHRIKYFKYQDLFNKLDSDGDGFISSKVIRLCFIPIPQLKALTPILEHLQKTQQAINFKDFCLLIGKFKGVQLFNDNDLTIINQHLGDQLETNS